MRFLLLNGHGINLCVDGAKLHIKDGFWTTHEQPEQYIFAPKRIPYDDIIIYGHSGNISLEAIKWLMVHNIGILVLSWDGRLLTYMQPKNSVHVKTKFQQYNVYSDEDKRLNIAKKLLEGKIARSQEVLEYLQERYPNVQVNMQNELGHFKKASSIAELHQTEARIAKIYWEGFRKAVPKNHEFESRQYIVRPMGAVDVVNVLLNYSYALLEAQCLKAIHAVGLDPYVGYLHEILQGKQPLVYDLQEPFRFLIDLAVLQALEKNIFDKKDFIRTENYNLRLRPTGARKLTEQITLQMNKKTKYRGREYPWHYVLFLKTQELAHYLRGDKSSLDFTKPFCILERDDTDQLREQIRSLSYTRWKKMGYSKGTLHQLKKKVEEEKPFTLNELIRERLNNL